MARAEASVHIDRPPDDVFVFVGDAAKQSPVAQERDSNAMAQRRADAGWETRSADHRPLGPGMDG